MKHSVLTINKTGKVVYEGLHQTAESAYDEYVKNIGLIKKFIKKDEKYTVVRVNEGQIMTMETIEA